VLAIGGVGLASGDGGPRSALEARDGGGGGA